MPQALFLEEKRRFWYSMNEESKQPFETEARDKHIASLFDFEKELVRTLSKDQKTGKKVYYANRERTLLLLDPRLSCKDSLKKVKCDWNEMSPEEQYNFLKNVYVSMTECEMRMAQMRAEASAEVEPGRAEEGESGASCEANSRSSRRGKSPSAGRCRKRHNPQTTQN